MNRPLYNVITIATAAALALASCVKDDLHNTPNPDKGSIVIAPDWSEALDKADIPQLYYISADGGEPKTASGDAAVFTELLSPGQHQMLVYNQPQGITINAATARVDLLADGSATPMPGYLFSASESVNVVADATQTISTVMKRRICPIAVILSLTGDNVSAVANIEASLSGLSESMNLQSGYVSGSVTVNLPVERAQNSATMRCRALGTNSTDRQTFTITLTMTDGYTQTSSLDFSQMLKGDLGQLMPIEIDLTLDVPQDGHFTSTITDWTNGNGNGESGDAK